MKSQVCKCEKMNLIYIHTYVLITLMILDVNVGFIELFVVSLERLFLKISNFHNCIKFQCIQVINRLKYNIKLFNQSVLDCQVLHTLNENNKDKHTYYKKKLSNVDNKIQSNLNVNPSSSCLQTKQNTQNVNNSTTLSNAHKKHLDLLHNNYNFNSGAFDLHLQKNSTLLTNGEENVPNKNSKPGMYNFQS